VKNGQAQGVVTCAKHYVAYEQVRTHEPKEDHCLTTAISTGDLPKSVRNNQFRAISLSASGASTYFFQL
jgi:hypothetical protein